MCEKVVDKSELPRKGSHSNMKYMGTIHPSKGREYRCPQCWKTMFWGEAKRHNHRPFGMEDE